MQKQKKPRGKTGRTHTRMRPFSIEEIGQIVRDVNDAAGRLASVAELMKKEGISEMKIDGASKAALAIKNLRVFLMKADYALGLARAGLD